MEPIKKYIMKYLDVLLDDESCLGLVFKFLLVHIIILGLVVSGLSGIFWGDFNWSGFIGVALIVIIIFVIYCAISLWREWREKNNKND